MSFVNGKYGTSKLSPEEVVEFTSLCGIISSSVEKQNPFAVMCFIILNEDFPGHDNIKNDVYPDTDGLTLQQ